MADNDLQEQWERCADANIPAPRLGPEGEASAIGALSDASRFARYNNRPVLLVRVGDEDGSVGSRDEVKYARLPIPRCRPEEIEEVIKDFFEELEAKGFFIGNDGLTQIDLITPSAVSCQYPRSHSLYNGYDEEYAIGYASETLPGIVKEWLEQNGKNCLVADNQDQTPASTGGSAPVMQT